MADRDTPQAFEESHLTDHQRYMYLKDCIEGTDIRWRVTSAAYNLRYRLDYYGLLGLAIMYYADNAVTAPEYPSLDKHAAEFYKPAVSRTALIRRCTDIGAHTGGTDLDLQFRLYLHAIKLPFWRPEGYYQDMFGVRWTPDMDNLEYLYHRRKAQREAEDQVFEAEVNRTDDLEVEDLQAGPVEDQKLRAPEHQVASQQHHHHRDPSWRRRVLRPVVWLLDVIGLVVRFIGQVGWVFVRIFVQQWPMRLLLLILSGFSILVAFFGISIASSIIYYVALAGFKMASGIISYLARYTNLGHVAWSYIRACWEAAVEYFRSPACPRQMCILIEE